MLRNPHFIGISAITARHHRAPDNNVHGQDIFKTSFQNPNHEQVKESAYLLNIELHFLPPYSPNLNTIERLWKVMNEMVRNNRYFTSAREFRQEIHNFFRDTLPALAGILSQRINDNFQVLKKASSS